jgi:hypothetical protein
MILKGRFAGGIGEGHVTDIKYNELCYIYKVVMACDTTSNPTTTRSGTGDVIGLGCHLAWLG